MEFEVRAFVWHINTQIRVQFLNDGVFEDDTDGTCITEI
jgi:hypothetical protein